MAPLYFKGLEFPYFLVTSAGAGGPCGARALRVITWEIINLVSHLHISEKSLVPTLTAQA